MEASVSAQQRLVTKRVHCLSFSIISIYSCATLIFALLYFVCLLLFVLSFIFLLRMQHNLNPNVPYLCHRLSEIEFCVWTICVFSGLEFHIHFQFAGDVDMFPMQESLTHRSLSPCSKQVSWLVLLYILWFNKENTNVSQSKLCWWYQCHAFHWFLFTWCPQDTRWLVALHTWPGNFVHLTGSRRVLWRSEKRQRDKN